MIAEFFWYGKNNMSVFAIDEFSGDGIRAICLISAATSTTEARFTAEGDVKKAFAMMAVVEMIPVCGIPAMNHLLNFGHDNRAYMRMFFEKRGPMIGKYLFN